MTDQRRRFFPSRPAQQVPGGQVNLALQLQKAGQGTATAASVTPPDTGGIVGVALFPALLQGVVYYDEPITAISGMRHVDEIYRPKFEGWRLVGGYVPILDAGRESAFDAVVIGYSSQAVAWTWTLDMPELPPYDYFDPGSGIVTWDGVTVEQRDSSLRITVLEGQIPVSGPPWWASLVCTASVGGEAVGRIVLRPGYQLNPYSIPLPE